MGQQNSEISSKFLQTRYAVANYLSRSRFLAIDRLRLQIRNNKRRHERGTTTPIQFRFSYLSLSLFVARSHLCISSHFTLHEFLLFLVAPHIMYRRKKNQTANLCSVPLVSRLPPIRCCASCFLSKNKI